MAFKMRHHSLVVTPLMVQVVLGSVFGSDGILRLASFFFDAWLSPSSMSHLHI